MKIALVNLGRTGAGPVYALEIAKALSRKTELLSIISLQAENIEHWRKSSLQILEVDTYKDFKQFVINTIRFSSISKIITALKEFKPDVIYTPMLHMWTPLIGFWFPRVPKVLTIHDPAQHEGEQNWFAEMIRDWSIKQSERIILLSKAFTTDIQKKGVPAGKIAIIPLGEFSYYNKVSKLKKHRDQSHPPTLLFFGRILPYKGLDTLLSAFPQIKEHVPNAQLLIVGNGDFSPYRSLIEGMPDIILVNNWIKDEDVGIYFEQADVVVLPYKDGTQSGVIPTAYTYRLPVIASNVGGLPEQVMEGETGILVNPNRPDELAHACITLLQDPEMAKKMGDAGFTLAEKEWNWDTIATNIVSVFMKCG